jgi:pimeloyl-ACP methyl ester carboxylesterase
VPEKYLHVDGVATFVRHTGATTLPGVAPDRSRGRTIVCLHDAGGHGGFFAELLAALAETQSPLAIDQPGHGRSAGLDSLGSVERMASFTAAFCAKLGLERPVLLGHGMGAAVALQLALDEPGVPGALVLCSSGARGDVGAEDVERMRRVSQGKERRPFVRELYAQAAAPELLRDGFMRGLRTDPRATYGDLQALAAWSADTRLGQLDAPALVVRGAEENDAVAKSIDALSQALNGEPPAVIESAGHMLPFEQPAALASTVASFLEGLA